MNNNTTNQTPKKEPSKTLIYVSNLPFDTNDEQLRDLFKGFNIKTAYVARRKNGKSKGFGFVNLEKESDQNAAIERINGNDFNSRKLIAKVAMDDERRNENGELKEEFKTQNTSAPSETVVYVSNLEWSVKDEDLKKFFAEFNPKVATVATRRNGRSKGFGFVEFNSKEDQEKALKLDNQKIGGREIIVKASTGYRGDNQNEQREKRLNVVKRTSFTLFISNLPLELDDNDLRDVFAEFRPKSTRIVSRDGKSKGFGFIEFDNAKDQGDAQSALDQSEINGRVVTVKFSTNRRGGNQRRNNNRNYNNNNNNNINRRNDNRRNDYRNDNRYNNRNDNRNDNRYDNRNDNRSRNNNNNNNRGGNRNYNNNNNNNNNNNRRNNYNNNNNNNNNTPKEVSTNMVYVSNLPFAVDDKGLEEIFKGLKITKAYVAKRRNGYSKGFGFVELATPEDQQKAINYNNNEVNGRAIVVQAAFKVENKTN